jgi:hypothetical protein
MNPHDEAERILREWERFLVSSRHAGLAHPYVYASGNRSCLRRMVYEATVPNEQTPFAAEILAKMRKGKDRERDDLADLQRIGRDADPPFEVLAQQEAFDLFDRKGRLVIRGRVDARLALNGSKPPLEVKHWSEFLISRVETFEDVISDRYMRSGAFQMLAYLFGSGEPYGFLLLDRSGLPKLLVVELEKHLDEMEDFLSRAEIVRDHIDAGTLPDYIDDPDECERCSFYGHTCNPPLSFPAPVVLADPALEAALERREALRPAANEYRDLDLSVKQTLRGIEHGIVAGFEIKGSWRKGSRLELPANLKKQYTKTIDRGSFVLNITKL